MLIITHLLFGLLIGKITGNLWLVVIGAVIVDLDHIYGFIKEGIIFNSKKLWISLTQPKDPFTEPRTIVHSLVGWITISLILIIINFNAGIFISIGYLSHLVLDALDKSDMELLFPLKEHTRGLVVYNSRTEHALAILFIIIFFIL